MTTRRSSPLSRERGSGDIVVHTCTARPRSAELTDELFLVAEERQRYTTESKTEVETE